MIIMDEAILLGINGTPERFIVLLCVTLLVRVGSGGDGFMVAEPF